MSPFEMMFKGGPVMIPILLGSFIGAAIICSRLIELWKLESDTRAFGDEVTGLVRRGRLREALDRCHTTGHPVAGVLQVGLEHHQLSAGEIERLMEHAANLEVRRLERYLGGLASIIVVEPLLGFLGTITGLIRAFRAWERAGSEITVSALAAGIYEAMMTTAAGLLIAIPLYVLYNYIVGRIKSIAHDMTDRGTELLNALRERQPGGPR